MADYQISYVLATHNQLPELRAALDRLLAARQPTEEIVVVDGASTDGSTEYLRQLHAAGHIQQLLLEPHKNQAHGLNKAFVLATGPLIKVITLADAFCLPAIREAADFMLEHPEVDVVAGNTGTLQLPDTSHLVLHDDAEAKFRRWFEHKEVVALPGLSLLIRREALALTGFLHTGVAQVEREFTYRLTSLNVGLAWSTALLAVYVRSQQPAPAGQAQAEVIETERMEYFHDKSQGSQTLQRIWRKSAMAALLPRPTARGRRLPVPPAEAAAGAAADAAQSAAVAASEAAMTQFNAVHPTEFVFRAQQITKAFQKPA